MKIKDEIINECKLHSHMQNKVTEQAIKDSYDEKSLIKSESIEDFFKKLGI